MAANDIPITKMLAELGVAAADEVAAARAAIEAAGLTNPRKTNISVAKREAVTAEIDKIFRRLCARCAADVETEGATPGAARDDRPVLRVAQPGCTRCGGSNNQRAVDEMLAACARAGVTKIVFVGGSPSVRAELNDLLGGRLELRLVEGTRSTTRCEGRRRHRLGRHRRGARHERAGAQSLAALHRRSGSAEEGVYGQAARNRGDRAGDHP